MMEKFRDSFLEEAYELLNNLEHSLLTLEEQPADAEALSAVFRAMHTIKGSAAMFGFQHISSFTHEVEGVLESVRAGRMPVTTELTSLTLLARDHVRTLLDAGEPVSEAAANESRALVERFRALIAPYAEKGDGTGRSDGAARHAGAGGRVAGGRGAATEVTYRIQFSPGIDIFRNGTNPLQLLRELRELGDCSCIPYLEGIPSLEQLDPESCLVHWDIILTTTRNINEIRDVFIFVEGISTVRIDVIDDGAFFDELIRDDLVTGDATRDDSLRGDAPSADAYPRAGGHRRLGEILVERGVVSRERVEAVASSQKRLGEALIESHEVGRTEVKAALEEQLHVDRARERAQRELSTSSIRVGSEKLDALVDLVGELVTLQARLSQTAVGRDDSQLTTIAETLERLTSELRDRTMSIRMLPIGTTFTKFKRLVRDLSRELGKQVEIITDGGETELDKTVIERLNDPLVHLIRNAVDHGIESPEARAAAGKSPTGTVSLSAVHAGASVLIRISDDGAGLNRDRILDKARRLGLVSGDANLTDDEVNRLIFAPGFSTAESVTTVSGRGVGMDVVRKEIEGLGGGVLVRSEPGRGTVITLDIPLTLAIIEGLLVEVAGEKYVFPLATVVECVELTPQMRREHGRRAMLDNRGEILPYVRLRRIFEEPELSDAIEQIVVVSLNGRKVGFVVDNVIGDYQTVIKNLGKLYRGQDHVSGATILGDGSVALILDVQRLTEASVRESRGVAV